MKPGRDRSGEKEFFRLKKSARRTRRTHAPVFKAHVVVAALREDRTLTELPKHFELQLTQIVEWKRQLLEHAAKAFGDGAQALEPADLAPLHANIGQLALQNDFLEGALTKAGLLSVNCIVKNPYTNANRGILQLPFARS